jgi:hypothetical protein
MTRQEAISLTDVVVKGSIPITIGLLCWQANRMIGKFDALEAAFNASQVHIVAQLGSQGTKIISLEQLLNLHLQQVQTSSIK